MDRTVDHTFVFMGDGVVKDFPGNYSEYRAWKDYHDREAAEAARAAAKPKEKVQYNVRDNSRKLTFKERRELEQLTVEIDELSAEKKALDTLFASGEVITDMDQKSARYSELQDLHDAGKVIFTGKMYRGGNQLKGTLNGKKVVLEGMCGA